MGCFFFVLYQAEVCAFQHDGSPELQPMGQKNGKVHADQILCQLSVLQFPTTLEFRLLSTLNIINVFF
jgi:hypothetical protein